MVSPDATGVIACNYGCNDCDFGGDAKNGVGLAAQHSKSNPDHSVWVEQVTSMQWEPR